MWGGPTLNGALVTPDITSASGGRSSISSALAKPSSSDPGREGRGGACCIYCADGAILPVRSSHRRAFQGACPLLTQSMPTTAPLHYRPPPWYECNTD